MKTRIESRVGAVTLINGREMDLFAGNGYLGLQSRPEVIAAASDCLAKYGVATAIPRGGLGEHPVYDELEIQASAFFGAEKVSLYASGYLGPSFLVQATATLFDSLFVDSDAHFSIWDAAQGTGKPITVFRHLDPADLEKQLLHQLKPHERPLILTDGVFPISGEIAPIPEYLALARRFMGQLYVDDAHAAGVLGAHGHGTADHFGIPDGSVRSCVTLSKAFGAGGGLIYGSKSWMEALEKDSRIFAGSTGLPLVTAAAAARALQIARQEPELRAQLHQNVALARQCLALLGLDTGQSLVPIICLAARPGLNLPHLRNELFKSGIAVEWVQHYPSAPAGGALRIAIFATHTSEQIERLINEFRRLL